MHRSDLDMGGMALAEKAGWLLFFALVAWQLYKAFTLTSFDGDDAEYVAQSLVTWQSNTMYLIRPYTGGTTSLDIRHSLAVLPIWVAYIGRMTGLHTTILAHSVLPFVWIPLTYFVFYEVGKHLLKGKKEFLPAFMVLMALLQIFGNVSIFTNETFFLTRTWQGKAVAASFFGSPFFIIPGFARNISSNTLRVQKQVKQHIYHVWNAGQPRFYKNAELPFRQRQPESSRTNHHRIKENHHGSANPRRHICQRQKRPHSRCRLLPPLFPFFPVKNP